MAYDRFLIAPFDENSGLTTNLRPWQIPDQAWTRLENMYVFRGRIKKRFGSEWMTTTQLGTRLRIQVGTTAAITGDFAAADIRPAGSTAFIGGMFSVGTTIFTIYQAAGATLTTGAATATFTVATGVLAITGNNENPSTAIYWYPAQPVMGLKQFEFTALNNYQSIGFDTQFAYVWNGTGWQLSMGSPVWHGTNADLFWATNWVGPNSGATALTRALFVSNFFVTNINGAGTANDDPVYYYDGTTWTAYKAYLNPGAGGAPSSGPFVETARLIFPFHGRLVYLNTIENDGTGGGGVNTNFVNRARWTSLGSPFAVNAWYGVGAQDNVPNYGINAGFADASTLEAIISAEFIKDRLMVYFEESTWELAYTGNEQQPFEWQKLNTELGSMATFSTISFDKAVLTVGETGIHSCNGSNVARIDQKIPDEIFKIANPANEAERTYGIRDYYNEMVYWSIPREGQLAVQPFPTRVLVYNYQNQTWAYNDDAITAFGYWDGSAAPTWATLQGTWEEWDGSWDAGINQQQVRKIIAGNQEGFVFEITTDEFFSAKNADVLQVTTMTQLVSGIQLDIYNHMLTTGDYVFLNIEPDSGVVIAGRGIYVVRYVNENRIVIQYPPEVTAQTGFSATFTGTYLGNANIARVSNPRLVSKQWNPYDKDGSNVFVAKIDFAVLSTSNGEITVNYSPSASTLNMLSEGIATNSITGTGVLETRPYPANLYPLEQSQARLWHPVYFQCDGECIQINMYLTPIQICNPSIAFEDIEIEGLILYTQRTSSRMQ